ncbi:DUF1775 domain-containing protein [Novosphingobium sp. FSY-8]|uniref:DUF1775 domain-containing protein n=1 Tax=Novosphingobium ovatum TaxID=1908523 RepID=A0ABW9XAM8_9SPHN|nr:DUF1775 domain-containing protein [Novosphingobium ovatum]NBC35585.1 DUF1775 domain-containing protein [Novosphingobium ovatum]
MIGRWAFGTAALMLAPSVQAHVTLSPAQGVAGARQVYVVRMPNERRVDTVALDLQIPAALRVTGLQQAPGWTLVIDRDATGAIVAVHWTGALPPDQYVEFGLMAVNPATAAELRLSARQTYANGEVVAWNGEVGSRTPAPRVTIAAVAAPMDHSGH